MPETTTVNFQSNIGAGASETLAREWDREAHVTRVYTVAVPGEAADVRRTWYVKRENNRQNILLDAVDGSLDSETYLAGDDTTWDLRVDEQIRPGDRLELAVENTDTQNAYPTIAFAEVSFGSGSDLLSTLRRVI
jgi:hypothetical protein